LTRLQHWIEQAAAQATKPGAPGDWDWTLGSLRTQLANLLALQNQFEKAKRELELALPSWQRLAKQHAKDAEAAVAVVRTLCGISIAYLRSGAPDKAIGALRPLLDWLKTSPPTPATASQIVERLVALQSKLKAPSGEHAAEQSALLRELDATLDRLKATPPIQQAPQQ
jgi:hypothetical protein